MAISIYSFANLVPTGVAIASPQTFQMQMPVYQVDWITVRVPPGPQSAVGFYLASSGNQIIPVPDNPPNWIVTDNEIIPFTLEDAPSSGDWQFVAYNTGNYAHTIYVRFGLSLPPDPYTTAGVVPALDLSSL